MSLAGNNGNNPMIYKGTTVLDNYDSNGYSTDYSIEDLYIFSEQVDKCRVGRYHPVDLLDSHND